MRIIYLRVMLILTFMSSQSFEDIVKDPGPKTTYEVAIMAPKEKKKVNLVALICLDFIFLFFKQTLALTATTFFGFLADETLIR